MTDLRIAAVMTVHNRRDTTLRCLQSLRAQERVAKLTTFVVDDGSTDGTAESIAAQFPEVTVLPGDGTLFWNGGMRLAFGTALQGDYDFYWWLNDDTRLDDHALRTLLDTYQGLARRGQDRAIVVGSTRSPDTGQITYGGVRRPSRLRPLQFELVEPATAPRECETMNGNCVLIPRSVTDRVGTLAPKYRQKMGDFDYGLRARRAGCSLWVAPGTIGTCATHPPRRSDQEPLLQELRRLYSVKELPFSSWITFARRWSGPFWPVYFASPYWRRGTKLLIERIRYLRRRHLSMDRPG